MLHIYRIAVDHEQSQLDKTIVNDFVGDFEMKLDRMAPPMIDSWWSCDLQPLMSPRRNSAVKVINWRLVAFWCFHYTDVNIVHHDPLQPSRPCMPPVRRCRRSTFL